MAIIHRPKLRLAIWEIGCVLWVCGAGSLLHFAFELSDYWTPMALLAAVNESAWEHTKMYFWPGLVYALVQYTYTRDVANNYWLGKAAALAITPLAIFVTYFSYMAWITSTGGKASLPTMLGIMVFGISLGQAVSWRILTLPPMPAPARRLAAPVFAVLLAVFSSFTYFPPRLFLFENFFCYQYTGEYGILDDYGPYRVFVRPSDEDGAAGGVNYCARIAADRVAAGDAPED